MGNKSVLEAARKKMQDIAYKHLVEDILIPFAESARNDAEQIRIQEEHNMTGNSVNSYAAGVYAHGKLIWDSYSGVPKPLQGKLSKGQRYRAGWQRWDGETQVYTFKAKVATNGQTEPERAIAFIRSYKAPSDTFSVVVTNGVEYAEFQQAQMGIDVLTKAYDNAKFDISQYLKPIPG